MKNWAVQIQKSVETENSAHTNQTPVTPIVKEEPAVEATSKPETKQKKSSKIFEFVDGKGHFNGKFETSQRKHPEFKQSVAAVPLQVHAMAIGICAMEGVTIHEAITLLLIDLCEKGQFPKELLKRYKSQL